MFALLLTYITLGITVNAVLLIAEPALLRHIANGDRETYLRNLEAIAQITLLSRIKGIVRVTLVWPIALRDLYTTI